ncbi:MAG TPA: glutathione S-transferase family protein [Solirubrobacteraceae bacterium]|nr:glutathione S-transferase family protein [Solirubrobacteraceae bacterium]
MRIIGRIIAARARSVPLVLLYDSPVSGNCYKVRLLFSHLGIEYERQELSVTDRSNRPDVLGGLNPALRVPTLILDDGRALAESHAIVWYFAEGTEYMPEDRFERARVLQWLCFEQYDLEPTVAVVRFWELYAASPPPREEIEARRAAGQRALGAVEQALAGAGPFLVAGRYTVADIAVYGYTHVAHEAGFDMSGFAAIAAWMERIREQPGHVEITD